VRVTAFKNITGRGAVHEEQGEVYWNLLARRIQGRNSEKVVDFEVGYLSKRRRKGKYARRRVHRDVRGKADG